MLKAVRITPTINRAVIPHSNQNCHDFFKIDIIYVLLDKDIIILFVDPDKCCTLAQLF
jgi:hypothetical protein